MRYANFLHIFFTFDAMKYIFSILVLFVLSQKEVMIGKVVRVADGDTITVLVEGNKNERIRLSDIDAPEHGQDFSEKSRLYLADMVAGKIVRIEYKERDMYGRILGTVFINGKNVNEEMVRVGLAWEYKYNKNEKITELQQEAKEKKLNIWRDKNPINPYDYRKSNQK